MEQYHKVEDQDEDEGDDEDDDEPEDDDGGDNDGDKKDRDPADTNDADNYDIMLGMWIPTRHLLDCAIYSYEQEYGEGTAIDLRKEFKTRYNAEPCLAKAIENYKRFNNVKKVTPKLLFNSGKSFEEWAEQRPILTGVDTATKNVPTYDASMSLVGAPNSKPEDKSGVGVCLWGDRWYNKNKRLPDKLTVKLPDRWVGKGKDGHWFPNVQELERGAKCSPCVLYCVLLC